LPRLGAVQALLNATPIDDSKNHTITNGDAFHQPKRSFYHHIIDVTMAYPDRKPITLLSALIGLRPISHVALHFRVKKFDHTAALNENQLRTLMYDIWIEKNQLLQEFYDHGCFPGEKIEDHLDVEIMKYVKGYGLLLPTLAFYAFCIWTCISYISIFIWWFVSALISLVY